MNFGWCLLRHDQKADLMFAVSEQLNRNAIKKKKPI